MNLERAALQSCGSVWFTSKPALDRYVADGAVEETKATWLPCFYDPDMYAAEDPLPREGLTILYGGDLSASYRSPEPFFQAWSALRHKCPEAFSAIRLGVYGYMAAACRRQAVDLGLWDQIDVRERIPYRDFLNQATKADGLLYLDSSEQEFFSPGKLADYFGASRPILAFTAEGSGVQNMLESVGMGKYVSDPNDKASSLESLIQMWNDQSGKAEKPKLSTDSYSLSSVCCQVDRLLKTLIDDS